jgi:hypothetical protein
MKRSRSRGHSLRRRYGRASWKGGLKELPAPGTRVRLTGIYLKNTGQQRGGEGSSIWTVLPWSESGFPGRPNDSFVVVNEAQDGAMYSDITSTRPDGKFMRMINKANLQIVGAKPKAADYP